MKSSETPSYTNGATTNGGKQSGVKTEAIHIQFISVNKLTNRKAKEQRKAIHNAYEAFKDCLSC